ncbi:MFS transporter [Rhodococcus qingshengii]|uniref:MFS transporter n=1 Tax=Rhodococcus qingshengii TaxID=334542 RepID=UPI0035F918D9
MATTHTSASQQQRVPAKVIASSMFGTVLEWYDFAIYGALAVVMARLFFPTDDPTVSLLITLGTYAVGFVCRPIGAYFFGRMGDRTGRRKMLAVTMIVVGGSSVLIGLLPTFSSIGMAAPLLLIALRMIQGFAVGAEWTGGATYLIEHARTGRRGLFGGIMQASTVGGFLLGTGVATILITALPESAIDAGVWRVPFILGGAVAAIGLYVRLKLDESPAYKALLAQQGAADTPDADANLAPNQTAQQAHSPLRDWLMLVGIVFGITVAGYTATSFPAFISGVTDLPLSSALTSNVIALSLQIPAIVGFGALSDRIGRKPLMIAGMSALTIVTFPVFLLVTSGSFVPVLIGQLLFVLSFAAVSGPMASMFVEFFPTKIRSTAFASSYNVSVALFGGTAPFVNTFLASQTHSPLAPATYLVVGALVSLALLTRTTDRYSTDLT